MSKYSAITRPSEVFVVKLIPIVAFLQARTMTAIERVRCFALEKRLDGLSMEEIDREISAARKKDEG